jgi:nucleoside-diphosphate-sugar epimerase
MKRVLVSGGAGYIGSVLVRYLLSKDYFVRVVDSLLYGGESILDLLNNENFEFVKGDIRNIFDLQNALTGIDYVVHLAAIVGDPACVKQPELAVSTNFEGSCLFYRISNEMGIKRFIFSSTCSNYGKMENPESLVTEDSKLAPVSLYAQTKVQVEQNLLSQPMNSICKPTCLRLSTAYGLSQRPRFDLTVNEFTKELAMGRELVVFGEQFWRPYCHVIDLARAVYEVLEADDQKVSFNVFNIGDTNENYQKRMIVEEIIRQLPGSKVRYVQKNEDPRDYKVSFEKIKNQLGFKLTKKVPDGIRQIIQVVKEGFFINPDDKKYGNI